MKHTKRLLSIVLMLTMLLSMFTVMAHADDPAPTKPTLAECETNGHPAHVHVDGVPATCTTDGLEMSEACPTCGYFYIYSTESFATTNVIPATGHKFTQDDVVHADATHSAYVHCEGCGKYFGVPNGNVEDADVANPQASPDAFNYADAACAHAHVNFYPEGNGYYAHAYCRDCKLYFSVSFDGSIIPGTGTADRDTFLQPIVEPTEAKYTVTVKISNASRGTVQVKDHGEWVTVKNGDKLSGKSKGGVLEFRATDYTTSKYSVSWTYGRKTTTGSTKEITITGDSTLSVSFDKKASHSHSYTYEYKKYDADEHKAYCSCGDWIYQDHDFEYVGNGYWKCEDCGYRTDGYYYDHTSSHTSYKYEDYNATYHYKECKKCDYEVKEYHAWIRNTDSKTKSSYPYVCKYCGRLSKTGNSDLPFHDVNDSYWYYDDVLYAYLNGLMDGISVNDFGANENTTRAQLVTILWRLTGEPVARKANKFSDVSSSSYYNDAISWAVDAGIVDGFDAYTFKPNANVTREQMAAILYRYASYMNLSTKGASNLLKFDDYYSIGTWAREPLAWANYHGLINGIGYSKIDPKGYATRAQVAAILHRFAVEFA